MKTIIVAGVTRSGLTLTMQMLYAGGYPCVGTWPAFEDIKEPYHNQLTDPYLFFEGKAIKMVDTNVKFPKPGDYHVIRLKRDIDEQVKSYRKFLKYNTGLTIEKMQVPLIRNSIKNDLKIIDEWGQKQSGFMFLSFEDILRDPQAWAGEIAEYIDYPLNLKAAAEVVAKRGPACLDYMLETTFLK